MVTFDVYSCREESVWPYGQGKSLAFLHINKLRQA